MQDKKVKAGVIGATGYAGIELVRLLLRHPHAELAAVGSVSFEGKTLGDVYPSLYGICEMTCVSTQEVIRLSDVVFACVAHGMSEDFARQCMDAGRVFIDLGADFRLREEEDYTFWYGGTYQYKDLHEQAVYALPEINREAVKQSRLLANPGCYPTSAALALAPALKAGLVSPQGIVIDAKSGVTGAGKALSDTTHFPACNESFSPYKIAVHRHTPEIEQTLSDAAGQRVKIVFVPHLLPLNRGILTTAYSKTLPGADEEACRAAYEDFYRDEPFVRVKPRGEAASLKDVRESNFCDISLHFDERTDTLIIVSAIDNMVKCAAGQAVQNMNIVFGLPEDAGLGMIPPAF